MTLAEARAGAQKLQKDDWLAQVPFCKAGKKLMRIRQLPLFRRRGFANLSIQQQVQRTAKCYSLQFEAPASKSVFESRLSGNHAEETLGEKKKIKKSSNKHLAETVHEVSFAAAAGFPAPHLKSHINHLLFETDLNQRGTHFRWPETERWHNDRIKIRDTAQHLPAWFTGNE